MNNKNRGRVICLDIGTVRTGAAVTDPLGCFATPIGVWQTANNAWLSDLATAVQRYNPVLILLGLPLRENGTEGPSAQHVRLAAKEIQQRFPIPIQFQDERYTTRTATAFLLEADVSRKKRKNVVDKLAATVILQTWLDSATARGAHHSSQ